jgi:DNA-binding transcriptional MerR regulator
MDVGEDGDAMTVDEVARRAGTTSRNVRSYQTRGLLPPPTMRGRTGLYGRLHLARLKLISSLQKRGYSLAAIRDLLKAWEKRQTVGEVLGLEQALGFRYMDERELVLTPRELAERFPMIEDDLELLATVIELELVVPIPPSEPGAEERYRVPSPRLLGVGQTLLEAGVPVEAALEELGELRRQARAMASRLIAMFTDHIWDPWVKAGRPASQIPDLVEKIKLLQPAPPTAVASVVAQALDREVARTVSTRLRLHPEDTDV